MCGDIIYDCVIGPISHKYTDCCLWSTLTDIHKALFVQEPGKCKHGDLRSAI